MSKQGGKKGGKGKSSEGGSSENKTNFGKNPDVAQVLESFLSDNASFSSSTVLKMVMDKIAELNDINDICLVPLKEKILDFTGAKDWAFFLATCFRKYVMDDLKYPAYKFEVGKALDKISEVYDLSMEDYMSHIDGDDEEDDSHHGRTRGHSE